MYMFGLIVLLFIHVVFWSGLYTVIAIAKRYGVFCVFDSWFSYLLIALAILSFLFPFVLYVYNRVKKKTINVFLSTFLVTLSFCIISGSSLAFFDAYYSDFTQGKWEERPSVRHRDTRGRFCCVDSTKNLDTRGRFCCVDSTKNLTAEKLMRAKIRPH